MIDNGTNIKTDIIKYSSNIMSDTINYTTNTTNEATDSQNYTLNKTTINKNSVILPSSDKKSFGIIIGIIFCIIILMSAVIIIIIVYKKKFNDIDITFIEKNCTEKDKETIILKTSKENTIGYLINKYYKKINTKNKNQILFFYNKESIGSEKNKNQKIKNFFNKIKDKQILYNFDNSTIESRKGCETNKTEMNLNFDVDVKNNQNINNSIIEILVIKNMKINFKECGKNESIEIYISIKKKVKDLIDMYYSKIIKNGALNIDKKIFLYNNENIASEENKNKRIEDFIQKDLNEFIISISVLEKGYIKVFFKDNKGIVTEIDISLESLIIDLINSYYKKASINNYNSYIFLLNEINIDSEEHRKRKIEDYVKKYSKKNVLNILVIEKGKIKINFYENNVFLFEIYKSPEILVTELISLYYEKRGIQNDNKKIFLCNKENISSEQNKIKKIGEFIKQNLNKYILNISIFKQRFIKVDFIENDILLFEINMPSEKKVGELFDIYYQKKGIKNENKKYFICNEIVAIFENNKNDCIEDYIPKDFNDNSLSIVVRQIN